jgi:hypothetical protein
LDGDALKVVMPDLHGAEAPRYSEPAYEAVEHIDHRLPRHAAASRAATSSNTSVPRQYARRQQRDPTIVETQEKAGKPSGPDHYVKHVTIVQVSGVAITTGMSRAVRF